jgi:flagellar biosynthesis/type III secretory pathway protein FliH
VLKKVVQQDLEVVVQEGLEEHIQEGLEEGIKASKNKKRKVEVNCFAPLFLNKFINHKQFQN